MPFVLKIITLAFFNNLRLKHGGLFQFENNQFYLVAIRPNSCKNTKSFGSHVYLHSQTQRFFVDVSFKFSNDRCRHMAISQYFCFLCNVLWAICWHYKILIFDVSLDINGQLPQKVKKSRTQ